MVFPSGDQATEYMVALLGMENIRVPVGGVGIGVGVGVGVGGGGEGVAVGFGVGVGGAGLLVGVTATVDLLTVVEVAVCDEAPLLIVFALGPPLCEVASTIPPTPKVNAAIPASTITRLGMSGRPLEAVSALEEGGI